MEAELALIDPLDTAAVAAKQAEIDNKQAEIDAAVLLYGGTSTELTAEKTALESEQTALTASLPTLQYNFDVQNCLLEQAKVDEGLQDVIDPSLTCPPTPPP